MRTAAATIAAILVAFLAPTGIPASLPVHAQQSAAPYVVIVMDDTGSLAGEQGAADILADVKRAAKDLIGSLTTGTQLLIVPFAGGPETSNLYPGQRTPPSGGRAMFALIDTVEARQNATDFIDALQANGQSTNIQAGVEFGLNQLRAEASAEGAGRPQAIYLFTDGIDTSGNPQWLTRVSTTLATLRQNPDLQFLYSTFVQFEGGPQLECPSGGFDICPVTSHTRPVVTAALADALVTFPDLSGSPAQSRVRVPVRITLGGAPPPSAEVNVRRSLDQDVGPALRLLEPSRLSPNGPQNTIDIDAEADPSLAPGKYTGTLTFDASDLLFVNTNKLKYEVSYAGPVTPTPTPSPTQTAAPANIATAPPTATTTSTATPAVTATALVTATPVPSPTPTPPCPDPSLTPPDCKRPPDPPPWWVWAGLVVVAASLAGVAENIFARRY